MSVQMVFENQKSEFGDQEFALLYRLCSLHLSLLTLLGQIQKYEQEGGESANMIVRIFAREFVHTLQVLDENLSFAKNTYVLLAFEQFKVIVGDLPYDM